MLTVFWHLSAATHGYMRYYMPTNMAVDWLRSPGGVKWAVPAALVAASAYLGLTAWAILLAARPGLGWLNVLVLLFFWNAVKFGWIAVLAPVMWRPSRAPAAAREPQGGLWSSGAMTHSQSMADGRVTAESGVHACGDRSHAEPSGSCSRGPQL
jgi:hypothetical protein